MARWKKKLWKLYAISILSICEMYDVDGINFPVSVVLICSIETDTNADARVGIFRQPANFETILSFNQINPADGNPPIHMREYWLLCSACRFSSMREHLKQS